MYGLIVEVLTAGQSETLVLKQDGKFEKVEIIEKKEAEYFATPKQASDFATKNKWDKAEPFRLSELN